MNNRVRYAPSPTGYQHIGSVRTALFNYLFARATGGTFILRIEDTDRERYREDALEDVYRTFDWLGFHWDEGPDVGGRFGPYFQSRRLEIYQEHARLLVESGKAYTCVCTPARLEELKKEQEAKKLPLGYDRLCRDIPEQEKARRAREAGIRPVVRLKIPREGLTSARDELLGDISWPNPDINPDPVLLKSDGYPTYHLANIVDDHLMEVTHVLRAQEWLSSVPLHVLLYQAFGWEPPRFCHLPMVLGQDGQKLSKRHGATRIFEFKEAGYLPEAVINTVALLGCSYQENREQYTLKELEELFRLDKLNKAPAVFDYRKLAWFNGLYIRKREASELQELITPYLVRDGLIAPEPSPAEKRILEGSIPLIRERLAVLSEAGAMVRFLFRDPEDYKPEELIPKKLTREKAKEGLEACLELLGELAGLSQEEEEQRFRDLAERLGIKLGDLLMPMRVAITGSRVSPPLLESIRLLGIERTRLRVERAIRLLQDLT